MIDLSGISGFEMLLLLFLLFTYLGLVYANSTASKFLSNGKSSEVY
jgi:hypothetical protein